MTKWLQTFGGGSAEGSAELRDLLGGKGANLAEMANLGLPVPPGFTVTTELCAAYYANAKSFPNSLGDQINAGMKHIEAIAGAEFGAPSNPLLVSVRSGSRASMPGMMDTVLNLGLNDDTAAGLAASTGDARFAYDSYRRFIQMYGNVVLGVGHHEFEDLLDRAKDERNIALDTDMTAEDWQSLIEQYKNLVTTRLGAPFPQDVGEQLWGAMRAVFDSWMNERALTYRRLYDIPESWGTAVNIQAMVFGNMGNDCATGVAFTRNPSNGDKRIYGEYLINAQGEDVVAGIRTPQPLAADGNEAAGGKRANKPSAPALETSMPEIYAELGNIAGRLEAHYRDMQDIEFTVQKGKLWMLQTRSGKRTAAAALQIAVDMVAEGVLDQAAAVQRIEPAALEQLLHPRLDPDAPRHVLTRGLPASPGAAAGKVVFSSERAEDLAAKGEAVILVRPETSPEDIHGMHAARAILTSRGGMTSHAAVVARGMGRPCITGAIEMRIDVAGGSFSVGGVTVKAGDLITVDGSRGEVLAGEIPTIEPEMSDAFATLMGWADEIRGLGVRANAETPADAATARKFGAEGIGLCRTEHMFFDSLRIIAMREMILADDSAGRRTALAKLLPMQRQDFVELFHIMAGLPVTIRLLDPPLHEFLPHGEAEIRDVAKSAEVSFEDVSARVAQLRENNPMLGHRGCRLGISHPEIYEMQVRAIFEAAIEASQIDGSQATILEIMIPLVMGAPELKILKTLVDDVAAELTREGGTVPDYIVGTMIELPRAALRAGDIAEVADFFSFGTNDLTQTTLGISRDDAASFMDSYVRQGLFTQDPFASLDQEGVGELIETACNRGRESRPAIKLGVCGEHGGDPASIHFFEKCGLDYVSCSPYRVPIARLAAAQARLKRG
ncbi:MAG: pyruvate, phosphate dikinase [Proteobacteria bacterium]|nr:pyruvate, phosphate dikinase [Pseudomonadota bacterium]MDA1355859.1 pyruvate, phosphate dikinase [Pseudomonadota bacterium]